MSPTTESPIDLHDEDFRRLGVRPHECRVSVIRRAATRSARALAEQQLDAPSEQVGLQLSRVATSAYRLMDPRQRDDSGQRVHIGRIVPVTLNFPLHVTLVEAASLRSSRAPFHDNFEAEPAENSEPETQPDFDWAIDLVVEGKAPKPRREGTVSLRHNTVKRTRRELGWVLVAVTGLIGGSILGFAAMRNDDPVPAVQVEPEDGPEQPLPSGFGSLTDPAPLAPLVSAPEPASSSETAEPMSVARSTEPDRSVSPPEPTHAELTEVSAADIEAGPAQPLLSNVEADKDRTDPATATGDREFLPDPFAALPAGTEPPDNSEATPQQSSPRAKPGTPTIATQIEPPAPKPAVVPDANAVRMAREQLISLVPELAHAVTTDDVADRIAAIESIQRQLKVGSVDFWAARIEVAALAWLTEDAPQVRSRLAVLGEAYQVPVWVPLSDSFVEACDLANLPATHQHLVAEGWGIADRLLVNRSYDQCRKVLVALESSLEAVELDSHRETLEQFSLSAQQMERLAKAERRMLDPSGQLDHAKADGKILGRYYCLMLRDWNAGLPWLVESSNSRIAGVARQEVAQGNNASADQRIKLAGRWLAAASRSGGRPGNSMRLHAIDLMQQAVAMTSGLKKLEAEREIDEALEQLPAYLQDLPQKETGPTPVSEPTQPSQAGLGGRIEIDGNDIGVQLDYQLGVALTPAALRQISRRMKQDLEGATVQLHGEFHLEEPTVVLVSLTEREKTDQTLKIDGRVIEFADSARTTQVTLPPGIHRIDWIIQATSLSSPTSLHLERWNSGRALAVVQPTPSPALRTTLTVGLVRSRP